MRVSMLNRELLQFTRNSGRITPRFAVMDKNFCQHAEVIWGIYREAWQRRSSRAQLDESLEPYLKDAKNSKLTAGLNKVILDHSEFIGSCDAEDAANQREMIFKTAAKILKDPPEDPQVFRQMVAARLRDNQFLLHDIYGDLPEFDILHQIPQWNVESLCNAYNIALVQGLLFYADSLELALMDTGAMTVRKFMRRLKFYRLLAEVHKVSAHEVKLTLSGPASLFAENRKYGLQLAAFFQVILLFKEWKLRAKLKMREDDTVETLTLFSSRCPLKSSLRHWAACVPDEVALFVKNFRQDAGNWVEAPEAELPRIAGYGTLFPDFSFVRASDPEAVIHVELFHRYYTHDLEARLEFLQHEPQFPLVVGIDRSLVGKNGEKELLTRYKNLSDHVFFFSNYPGCERVRKMLDKVSLLAYQ